MSISKILVVVSTVWPITSLAGFQAPCSIVKFNQQGRNLQAQFQLCVRGPKCVVFSVVGSPCMLLDFLLRMISSCIPCLVLFVYCINSTLNFS